MPVSSADAENTYYAQDEADLVTPSILRFGVRMRFVSGAASTASRAPASFGFRLGPDRKKNAIYIRDGSIFLLTAENTAGPSVSIATSDQPHDYLIVADLTTGAIEARQDGVVVLTGATYPEPDPNAPPGIYFGEASLFGRGVSEWLGVEHNAHAPNNCP